MHTSRDRLLSLLLTLAVFFLSFAAAAPQKNGNRQINGGGNGGQSKRDRAIANVPEGISQANDGSTILDTTQQINGLPIRYRISAPAQFFTQNSGVQGAQATPGSTGQMGINVLLHGDGGQSFFDFPNQGVRNNIMGVAVLSPDSGMRWGGADQRNQPRPDGPAHSQAVADLITKVMPQMVAFDNKQVHFTGVSGGSLLLTGSFMPAHMDKFPNSKVLAGCAAMAPQVQFTPQAQQAMASTRLHFQSTVNELESLQTTIPQSITAYKQVVTNAGLNDQQLGALQTANNSPKGGHCAFDEKNFISGVQLMADSFGNIMLDGGNGQLGKFGDVRQSVVGANLQFGQERRQ
ncbi:hypothetical protein L249_8020 [Ophiocordyceps polyrhachis-furcata BCC 54312]|uniref:Uncharacterized protein n=1 Tax=Ophiocordyceps polyrhachis-furcata BCC 54312 TaxID=1330021 RepID=A0A367LHB4_9HYPO|nr:hypothetical protein L249_8020 [Ophiocordyceps polyrhachis-furcata BCC 54312]